MGPKLLFAGFGLLLISTLLFLFCVPTPTAADYLDDITKPEDRRDWVRLMAFQAWTTYALLGWGQESIKPASQILTNQSLQAQSGETIFVSLPTLYLMKWEKEFADAKEWIKLYFDVDSQVLGDNFKSKDLWVYINPLLSTYALTRDEFFLGKAKQLAEIDSWKNPDAVSIEDQLMEYAFLSDLTGNRSYVDKVARLQVKQWAEEVARKENYFLNGYPYDAEVKRAIQSGGHYHTAALDKYRTIMHGAESSGLLRRTDSGDLLHYRNLPYYDAMLYKHCQLGAIFMAGADVGDGSLGDNKKDEELARALTDTCLFVANGTTTHLPPYKFQVLANGTVDYQYERYELSHELPESYLALWRSTKNQKYRDAAWEIAIGIYRHGRFGNGAYGSVKNVNVVPTTLDDHQPLRLLSGTLHFLYLIFSPDDLLPTTEWVFNGVGHPFPICGAHKVYPETICGRGGENKRKQKKQQ